MSSVDNSLKFSFFDHCIIPESFQPIVKKSDYTINFIWVNLNPQDRVKNSAENIFGDGTNLYENSEMLTNLPVLRQKESLKKDAEFEKVKKTFTYKITKWADVHPNGVINIWYDSALVTQKAIDKTFETMQAVARTRNVALTLRDIRKLPNVQGELKNSLHPGTPVYFRVDLVKVLIVDHMMSAPEQKAKYCIVSDVDMEPMNTKELFDRRTLFFLTLHGYVFNNNEPGNSSFDNNFYIFNREKADLQRAHSNGVIKRIENRITELRVNRGADIDWLILHSEFIHRVYYFFLCDLEKSNSSDSIKDLLPPRKVVKGPVSQFQDKNKGIFGDEKNHITEKFRFLGDSNIPVTLNGRNYGRSNPAYPKPIEALKDWKPEPLPDPKVNTLIQKIFSDTIYCSDCCYCFAFQMQQK